MGRCASPQFHARSERHFDRRRDEGGYGECGIGPKSEILARRGHRLSAFGRIYPVEESAFAGNMKTSLKSLFLLFAAAVASGLPLVAGNQYSVVANASSPGPKSVRGQWVWVASEGRFYGASQFGGDNSQGSVFHFDPATGQYTVTHSFTGGNGGFSPSRGIIEAGNGRFYGATHEGGMNNLGTLFTMNQSGSYFEVIHQFASATGGNPDCAPIDGSDGKIYGVTSSGCDGGFGGFYRIDRNGANFQLLRAFTGTSGSTRGKGVGCVGLVEGPDGLLYGVTSSGGSNDTGVFFAMNKEGTTYNVFREWPTTGLHTPVNRLLLASDGFFYGTTWKGGAANKGGIYRISKTGDYRVLHEFTDSLDGYGAFAELVEGGDGYLYGVAFFSSSNNGSVFRLPKDGRGFAVLHRFAGGLPDGAQPDARLIETQPGVFYGSTTAAGANSGGNVFRLETAVERPRVKISGPKRRLVRGRSLRLRGSATDDLGVVRVEYTAKKAYKPGKGTVAWSARIPVKRSAKRVVVRVRAFDNDAQFSAVAIVRARRPK